MIKVAPSILSADFTNLGYEIKRVEEAGADWIHIDVMDGHFVPNISMGAPVVKSIRKATKLPFDVHLMIENPDLYIEDFVKAGSDIITVQVEACRHLDRTISLIKSFGVKAGVSLNPATPTIAIENVLEKVDMVLIMSVNPGFSGQSFIKSVLPKIKHIKKLIVEQKLPVEIQVDGGVNLETFAQAKQAGADILVAASAIYGASDIKSVIDRFKNG